MRRVMLYRTAGRFFLCFALIAGLWNNASAAQSKGGMIIELISHAGILFPAKCVNRASPLPIFLLHRVVRKSSIVQLVHEI